MQLNGYITSYPRSLFEPVFLRIGRSCNCQVSAVATVDFHTTLEVDSAKARIDYIITKIEPEHMLYLFKDGWDSIPFLSLPRCCRPPVLAVDNSCCRTSCCHLPADS